MSNENRYDSGSYYVEPAHTEIIHVTGNEGQEEAALLRQGQELAQIALHGHIAQSRAGQQDTAITHAQAHLIASVPQLAAIAAIVTGLILLAGLVVGGSVLVWIGLELAAFGIGGLIILLRSRRQGLEHTPAGVERHEIDARTRIAMHAIDRHCETLERIKGMRK